MGMYDNISCDYPLPGKLPSFIKPGHVFQTKDLDQCLIHYHITKDGLLETLDQAGNQPQNFSGEVEFYDSNICASGPGIYTRNGEDAESVSYLAVFEKGKLQSIKEVENTKEPALKAMPIKQFILTPEDKEKIKRRRAESLFGKRVYVLWGGKEEGYFSEVVAENDLQLCLKNDQKMELMFRSERDHIFWDTAEEAKASRVARQKEWNERKAEYDAYCEKWKHENS